MRRRYHICEVVSDIAMMTFGTVLKQHQGFVYAEPQVTTKLLCKAIFDQELSLAVATNPQVGD